MQALRERISHKLSDKSKSKDKDKDGSAALKANASPDGKLTTLNESHHQGSSSSITAAAASASAVPTNVQSADKGIGFFFRLFCFLAHG